MAVINPPEKKLEIVPLCIVIPFYYFKGIKYLAFNSFICQNTTNILGKWTISNLAIIGTSFDVELHIDCSFNFGYFELTFEKAETRRVW